MITKKSNTWSFSDLEWNRALELWDGCAYCSCQGVIMARDHFIPEAMGGCNSLANIVPACKACNSSKGMLRPQDWRWTGNNLDILIRVMMTIYSVHETIYGSPPHMTHRGTKAGR